MNNSDENKIIEQNQPSQDVEETTSAVEASASSVDVLDQQQNIDEKQDDLTDEASAEGLGEIDDGVDSQKSNIDTEVSDEITSAQEQQIEVEFVESPYIKEQYLRYGQDEDYPFVNIGGTLSYLKRHGFGDNGLTEARLRIAQSEELKKTIEVNKEGVHYCDFCGQELGVEYDVLSDGRERCYECSKTTIESLEEFKEVYLEVKKNMEVMFGINFFASISVVTTNSREIAKETGQVFIPSPSYDGRVLGFATMNKGEHSIHIENQSPYLCAVATIAHEMTHIWQYINWDSKAILKKYSAKIREIYPNYDPRLIIYEGMAKWVEIQYLYLIKEDEKAYIEMINTINRDDEYGLGFILYYQTYGMTTNTFIQGKTPFMDKDNPL